MFRYYFPLICFFFTIDLYASEKEEDVHSQTYISGHQITEQIEIKKNRTGQSREKIHQEFISYLTSTPSLHLDVNNKKLTDFYKKLPRDILDQANALFQDLKHNQEISLKTYSLVHIKMEQENKEDIRKILDVSSIVLNQEREKLINMFIGLLEIISEPVETLAEREFQFQRAFYELVICQNILVNKRDEWLAEQVKAGYSKRNNYNLAVFKDINKSKDKDRSKKGETPKK